MTKGRNDERIGMTRSGRATNRLGLAGKEGDASGDEHCGDPAAAVDFLVEEDFGGEGVADEGERGGGGGDEADIPPGEREEEAEEGYGHGGYAQGEVGVAEDAGDDGEEAGMFPEVVDVSDLLHGAGKQHVSEDRGDDDSEDGGPGVEVGVGFHGSTPLETVSFSESRTAESDSL